MIPQLEKTFISMLDDIFGDLLEFLRSISVGTINRAKLGLQHCELADKDHEQSDRVYAHVGCEPDMICVSEAMGQDFSEGKLVVRNIKGILLHEIGHILYDKYHQHLDLPDTDDPEVLADSTVYKVFLVKIFYDHRKIQWVDLD